MRIDKKSTGRFQLGGRSFTVTDKNANTKDQKKPRYGHNLLSSLAYQFLPETEIGTNMWYYKNAAEGEAASGRDIVTIPNLIKNLPNIVSKRRSVLAGMREGQFPDGVRLTNDLYGQYLGVDVPSQSLTKYKGELPEDIKKEKDNIYSLPKTYEQELLQTARDIYEFETNYNKDKYYEHMPTDGNRWETRKRKGDFVLIPIEGVADEALGTVSLWYNPKTDEVRYYDKYDLDQIPLMDNIVGKPFHIYGRVTQKDLFKSDKETEKQQGGTVKIDKKNTKKWQLGGLGSLGNIDWSNYESVLGAGSNLVGDPFQQALAADDPSILENYFLKGIGQAQATAANPLLTQDEIFNQANDAAKQDTFLGIGKKRKRRQYQETLNQQNQVQSNLNQVQGGLNTVGALGQFGQLTNLLGLLEFQKGGMARLGYSKGSPYEKEPFIAIPGNKIDMSNTEMTLRLIPDVGKPKTAKPKSGLHTFPNANMVIEIPMKKKGGKAKKEYNYFQQGGEGAVGAQLEKGELFVTGNLDILDTAAKLLHKEMKKDKETRDKVTDVLGATDYVISDLDKMKITRKQADDISFGMGGVLYEEGKIPDEPMELKASNLFKDDEDELKLTEYARRIRDTYKITDKESVFDKKTNAANKESRKPFIEAMVAINENRRTGGNPQTGFASTFENKFKTALTTDGNPIRKEGTHSAFPQEGVPERFQLGGAISAGLGLISGIGQWIGAGQNYRDSIKALNRDRGQINSLANTQSKYSGLATGIGLAGYANQNPYVEAPQYDSTQLDASIRRVPRTLFDFTAARLSAGNRSYNDAVFRNAGSFSEGVNAIGQNQAATQGAIANLGLQEMQQNIGLENAYRNQKQAFSDRQILADVTGRNATRTNANRLLAGTAGTLSGGIQSEGQIQSNRINQLRQNDFAQTQAKLDRRGARNQAFSNIAGSVGSAAMYADQQGLFGNQPVQAVDNSFSPNPNWQSGAPQVPFGAPDMYGMLQPVVSQPPLYGGVPTPQSGFIYDPMTGQRIWR